MSEFETTNKSAEAKPKLPITVSKPTPYTFDLGHLLANDPNPIEVSRSEPLNASLKTTARDGVQSLLNQLLTTCPITSSQQGVLLTLPSPATVLPRHKPLPTPKPPTKWELFARKKGIGKYSAKPGAALADKERRKKMVYDEEKGDWVPRWGYKGNNKSDDDWLVEVNEKDWKKEEDAAAQGSSIRGMSRAERKDRIRRNERKMRSNERKTRKPGSG
ncbi:Rhodanese- sulfurtransferase [Aspergillus melleus]|uniref:Rhodanese- sulfurtransferase n=1 Tax=Aspergillus melleus TaxID=138277 RepID=A0ACC3B053_9EURO|nr:Rhodanese- sulfurtransferase [Aspergillus melleus]